MTIKDLIHQKKMESIKKLNQFLKENGYNFGHRNLAYSVTWTRLICQLRREVSPIELFEYELGYLKVLRIKINDYNKKKHHIDYDPLEILREKAPFMKFSKPNYLKEIEDRIKKLEKLITLRNLEKIKISPQTLIILVWCYAIKLNRSSIKWNHFFYIFNWFFEDYKNSIPTSIFGQKKMKKTTLQKKYYKYSDLIDPEAEIDKDELNDLRALIVYIYKKSFIENKIADRVTIPYGKEKIQDWK